MYGRKEVEQYLNGLGIEYHIVDHPAAWTTEDADKYIEGMEGIASKTLLMAGRKDRKFYMFIMDEKKMLDLKKLGEITQDRLHFAKEEYIQSKLGLVPGVVSLFGLLNNEEHDIAVFVDKEVLNERIITFHPNVNTGTLFMSVEDMFKVLKDLGYSYQVLDL